MSRIVILLLKAKKYIMVIASLIISIIALILAGIIYIKGWAVRSLLSHLQVKPLESPVSDGERTYWLVELTIGKGNLICRIIRGLASMNLSASVTFEPGDEKSGIYNSNAYEIEFGIRNRRIIFPIIPNIRRRLAIVQRFPDLSLRTFGDSFGYSHLDGSYDIIISFKDDNGKVVGKKHRVYSYIQDGNPNISGWKVE